MGFRNGAYATVWGEPQRKSDKVTQVQVSVSKKGDDGEWVTTFRSFVSFVGQATASRAASLRERDRIRLMETDVTTKYVKETDKSYTNFQVYSFQTKDEFETQDGTAAQPKAAAKPKTSAASATVSTQTVDEGYNELDDDLPF